MTPPKREPHRAKRAEEPIALDWWVKDFRIFVPVAEVTGASDVVEKRLPLSLRNALQRYAQELARKVRVGSSRISEKAQVDRKRGARRKARSSRAPGLMDVMLAGRCLSK